MLRQGFDVAVLRVIFKLFSIFNKYSEFTSVKVERIVILALAYCCVVGVTSTLPISKVICIV
jgi:hypothetical protein